MTWRKIAYVWAVIGLTVSLSVAVASLLPFVPPVPDPVVVICFGAMFPPFASAVISGRLKRGWQPKMFERGVSRLPFPTWIGVVLIFAVVCFISVMAQLPGQPEASGGQYWFNNHGSLEPTDHAGYERGLRAQERIFTGVPAVFYAAAVIAWARKPGD